MKGSLRLHQVAAQFANFVATQFENVAEGEAEDRAIGAAGLDGAFGHDDVVARDHTGNRDFGGRDEAFIRDVFGEVGLAAGVERAGDQSFHVVGQAGEDLRMIVGAEAVHVGLDGRFVSGAGTAGERDEDRGQDEGGCGFWCHGLALRCLRRSLP